MQCLQFNSQLSLCTQKSGFSNVRLVLVLELTCRTYYRRYNVLTFTILQTQKQSSTAHKAHIQTRYT